MKYTIGLDFGTHQTKCCVEERDRNYQKFRFVEFANSLGVKEYRLPSVVKLRYDGKLEYGFCNTSYADCMFRYFKQASFNYSDTEWNGRIEPFYITVWYLTYLLFCLKKDVGEYFDINMGIPTDSVDYNRKKTVAVGLLKSAYILCEQTFNNNMNAFLNASYSELMKVTKFADPFETDNICKEYGIKVFPEAWACLRPLLNSNRLISLNLLIDIGGGTTDISLFSVTKSKNNPNKNDLKIYYYTSVNKGLNFIVNSPVETEHVNVSQIKGFNSDRLHQYLSTIKKRILKSSGQLEEEFQRAAQGEYKLDQLNDVIRNKQTIYVGGGSTFSQLRQTYKHFTDNRMINTRDWKMESIISFPKMDTLCPILSTAYGLAISEDADSIEQKANLRSLFDGIRNAAAQNKHERAQKAHHTDTRFGRDYGGFSYNDDYDAWK